jgi:hypothetical protein
MTNLCPFAKYSNIFGKPNTGAHKYKFLNTSIVDYVMTLIGIFVITFFTGFPLELVTIVVFILGIILHILFGVPTHTPKFLGINCLSK